MSTSEEQIGQALQGAQHALDAAERSIVAVRAILTALAAVIETSKQAESQPMIDVYGVVELYPKLTKRTILDAYRKHRLRGSKPAGSRTVLFTAAAVEEWVHSRGARSRPLRVVR